MAWMDQYSCGHERANFLLALDDQPQRYGLHASGAQSAAHFVPQQRRNLIAHDTVKHPARLLRVHQVLRPLGAASQTPRGSPSGVISLNVTRKIFFGSIGSISMRSFSAFFGALPFALFFPPFASGLLGFAPFFFPFDARSLPPRESGTRRFGQAPSPGARKSPRLRDPGRRPDTQRRRYSRLYEDR